MAYDEEEMRGLRTRMHDAAEQLHASILRTETTAIRLEAACSSIDRIADAISELVERERERNGKIAKNAERIAVLEALDAKSQGGKWGAVGGGLIAALAYWLQQLFGGGKS